MKSQAQVVVIGGGLIGCSILYHLTKLGCTDAVLLERDELTSGSTWHAAAGIHGLHDNNNISRLQYYTMQLYKDLERETGQGCGIFQPGSLYLAQTAEREHQLRIQAAKARYFDVEFHELSLADAAALHPLINFTGIRCVMYEPDGGNVDPSGVTHAYAHGARAAGAEIYRFTPVLETLPQANGGWLVVTEKGSIRADVVVNAAGLWGREVARLAGFELPLMTMEHQYFVTDDIPAIVALEHRLPSVADRDSEYYLRQEGNGLLVGAYEKNGKLWAEHGTPLDFGHELLADDLDRLEDNLASACERLPVLENTGVKRVINGPMIWSPDSAALVGPVPELKNYYCCNGIIPGFSQSGGLGLLVAQWIVEGEPEMDLFPWDLARFGSWADKTYTRARAQDCYSHRYKIHFPYEEREAGRPVRTRPVHALQKTLGGVFGSSYGWEHPAWFATPDESAVEQYGFERQNCFQAVARECQTLRQSVGIIDISNYAKYEISGAGSEQWLDRLIANHVPVEIGRSCLTPVLGVRGGIAADFTLTKLAHERYLMIGSGIAERFHQRLFTSVQKPDTVALCSITDEWVGFNVAGPMSRDLLHRLTNQALDSETFGFMRSKQLEIAGLQCIALRVSFTGDLGWELYVREADQLQLYEALIDAGKDLAVCPVGSRALLSLRLEKGYGSWGREYSTEYWPQEAGLDKLIKLSKPEFVGREAYLNIKDNPPRETLVSMEVEVTNADASGGEPVFNNGGKPVGRVSSGAYGHTVGKSLAMAYIASDEVSYDQEFEVAILGQPHRAWILSEPAFDPAGERLRA